MEAADYFFQLLESNLRDYAVSNAGTTSEKQRRYYCRAVSCLQSLLYCEVLLYFYSSPLKILSSSFLFARNEPGMDQVTVCIPRVVNELAQAVTVLNRAYRMSSSNSGKDADC